MRIRLLPLIGVLLIVASSCGSSEFCGDDVAPATLTVDATALDRPGSHLQVCIDESCNAEDDAGSEVRFHWSGSHPKTTSFSVTRVTGGSSFETLGGGDVDLPCSSEQSRVAVSFDENGEATITRTP